MTICPPILPPLQGRWLTKSDGGVNYSTKLQFGSQQKAAQAEAYAADLIILL
jgi:hypothetical protein